MRPPADEMVGRGVVVSVGRETVRKALEQNAREPWLTRRFCIPERDAPPASSPRREQVPDAYQEPPDPDEPLACMDEAGKEPHADVMPPPPPPPPPPPMRPGTPARADDEHERDGRHLHVRRPAPLGGRRAAHRARAARAAEVRRLPGEDFPPARRITLACDNLNTRGLARRGTPRSRPRRPTGWPGGRGWSARRGTAAGRTSPKSSRASRPARASAAGSPPPRRCGWPWPPGRAARDLTASVVRWQFTTADARVKLRHLYPQF